VRDRGEDPVMTGGAMPGARLLTCVVCGAQFLRTGGRRTTCSMACLGSWRVKNKSWPPAAAANAPSPKERRQIAEKVRK
jgi:hypothetical protein